MARVKEKQMACQLTLVDSDIENVVDLHVMKQIAIQLCACFIAVQKGLYMQCARRCIN